MRLRRLRRPRRLVTAAAGVALLAGAANLAAAGPALAATAFGLTTSSGAFTVSTGAGLVYTISRANGDLTSLMFNGTELQNQKRPSHVESGLSGATVSASRSGRFVVITEETHSFYGSGTLDQYLVARRGDNAIYLATFVDAAGAGELRWYQSLDRGVLTNTNVASDTRGGTAIESTDIDTVDGQTRSKYYSNRQAMNLTVRGETGSGVGVFMAYGNRESSAGGPFFRDIEQQGTDNNDLYNYLWSAHNQTEPQRLGVLYGPYALLVTTGSTPAAPDLSFMDNFGFTGTVPASGRGRVSGTAAGVPGGRRPMVGFANSTAQYWAPVDWSGRFTSPLMKPGSYTETLYQGELGVATRTVSVTAGATSTGQNLTSQFPDPPTVFRIGRWDGMPASFKNARNLTTMHPSDARMASWGPTTFTVGSSSASAFPSYQWKDVNNPTTVTFSLTAAQVTDRTVRIGLTAAFAGGRPQITVNGQQSAAPARTTQPDSRSLTIGTYRGNNVVLSYPVPASALHAGSNTLTITVISGSSGTGFLSPGVSYDAVDLS